ncbi:hypothetical protein [Kibdelosporangium philippinense]|uniref:hypothetical protein n=1 Tax=Kibdelosporangium philippinense TaxID=211113 RepID=UPI00361E768B
MSTWPVPYLQKLPAHSKPFHQVEIVGRCGARFSQCYRHRNQPDVVPEPGTMVCLPRGGRPMGGALRGGVGSSPT